MLNSNALSAAFGTKMILPNWILVLGVSGHGILAKEELDYRTEDTMDIAKEKNVELTQVLGDLSANGVSSLIDRSSEPSYWKNSPRGDCREVIFTSTLDQVEHLHSVFSEIADQVGFPKEQIGAYVQPVVQGISTHCGFDLYCDPANDSEVESVNNLLREGRQKLLNEGAFFSRPYGSITDVVFEQTSPEMVKAIQSVKKIFDPNNVLNPGTLCFKEVPK
jgi:hypothetical protein